MSSTLPQQAFWDSSRKWLIPQTTWTLEGHSRAMERTGFLMTCDGGRVMLDGGVVFGSPEAQAPQALCITHGHIDHANALPMLLRHTLADGAGPMHILAPRDILPRLVDFGQLSWAIKVSVGQPLPPVYAPSPEPFVKALMEVGGGTPVVGPSYKAATTPPGTLKAWVPMDDASMFPLTVGRKAALGKGPVIHIQSMALDHGTPTVGYLFSFAKQTLKECLKVVGPGGGLDKRATGEAVKKARVAGEDVYEELEVCALAFLCDTRSSIFWDPAKRSILEAYSTIMVECTYLHSCMDEIDFEAEAEARGHVCWCGPKGLAKVVKGWQVRPNTTTWVLMHFSLRHSDKDVVDFFSDSTLCGMDLEATTDPNPLLVLWLDTGLVCLNEK